MFSFNSLLEQPPIEPTSIKNKSCNLTASLHEDSPFSKGNPKNDKSGVKAYTDHSGEP